MLVKKLDKKKMYMIFGIVILIIAIAGSAYAYYSAEDLLKYLSKLSTIDEAIKSSNQDGNMLFELFIIKKDYNKI